MRFQDAFEYLIPRDYIHIEAGDPFDRVVDNDADVHGTIVTDTAADVSSLGVIDVNDIPAVKLTFRLPDAS